MEKHEQMNDFDWGITLGKLFISWIINDDFCGIAIRIGKEYADDVCQNVYHATMQLGYGQLTIGIIGN